MQGSRCCAFRRTLLAVWGVERLGRRRSWGLDRFCAWALGMSSLGPCVGDTELTRGADIAPMLGPESSGAAWSCACRQQNSRPLWPPDVSRPC